MRAAVRSLNRAVCGATLAGALSLANGQPARPIGDPTGRSGEPPPFLQEAPKPPSAPVPILPPPPSPAERGAPAPGVRVFVREIKIAGSTAFSRQELAAVTAPYVNRSLSEEDLEALRVALTLLYTNKGYVNSGATLPDQDIREGVVTYQIVEGRISGVELRGNRWFRNRYLSERLMSAAGPPLDVNALQQRFRLLLDDPRVERLNAELRPGVRAGEAILDVQVDERSPYRITGEVSNYQSPSVGAKRALVSVEHLNLTGNGDAVRAQYGRSEGLDPLLDLRYALPISRDDTTVSLQYRKNTFAVVEEPFKPLDIRSESEIYGLSLRHPVSRTLTRELALEATAERLSNRTTLLGEPFSLSAGAVGGKSVVAALRVAAEGISRTAEELVAFRSRFSFGIDALQATINETDASGKFFAWLGQFHWVRRPGFLDSTLLFRADAQLSGDRLLALEQFPIGGRYSVRGYRENTFVRDNAFVSSLEARVPIVRNAAWSDYLELAGFADYGRAWNASGPDPRTPSISSVGIGLRWGASFGALPKMRPQLEVYYGHALRSLESPGNDLQDRGIHFQISLSLF